MTKYAINYSLMLAGYITVDAKSKSEALRQFDDLSNIDLIDGYDEFLEVDIHSIDRLISIED
jgi:hypothetical protein